MVTKPQQWGVRVEVFNDPYETMIAVQYLLACADEAGLTAGEVTFLATQQGEYAMMSVYPRAA